MSKTAIIKAKGTVHIPLEIYRTIIATTVRYANARIPEDNWAEVYGLLYGYNKGDDVIITEAIPFTHTKKKGVVLKVEFDEEDYALAADIETQMYDRTPPQFIVGWYHSHPGIKVMLSQDDVKTQLSWQTNNPLAIALVFNHVRLVKQTEVAARKGDPLTQLTNDPGFLVYRLDDPNRGIEAQYHQLPFVFDGFAIDENLIKNAQEFVGWVTKAFPAGDAILTEYKAYVDKKLAKLNDIYTGTDAFFLSLTRQGQTSKFMETLETQTKEAQRVLDEGNKMIEIFRLMETYLEYKERERMIPLIETELKRWDAKAAVFIKELQALADKNYKAEIEKASKGR